VFTALACVSNENGPLDEATSQKAKLAFGVLPDIVTLMEDAPGVLDNA
jgi:hypothetical protein